MRKRSLVSLVFGVAFSLLTVPRAAQADPIVITGGTITASSPLSGVDWNGFLLSGAGSSFSGVTTAGPALIAAFGGATNLSGSVNLISTVPFPLATPQIVNGTPFVAFVNGGLTFTSAPVVIPPASSTSTSFEFSAPFTATGHIDGTATLSSGAPELFSTDLQGQGTTTISGRVITQTDQPFYLPMFQTYQFQAAAVSSTPEPTSLVLLLGGGLVSIGARRWRTRRRRS